jgi:phosphodiesterase/alkaline phosphatase D-like protein
MHSRRQFLARSAIAGAAIVVPPALSSTAGAQGRRVLPSGEFAEGVASGDPGARAMTLWTRVAELERKGGVRLEVARDKGFRHVVARKTITTSPALGGSATSSTSTASRPAAARARSGVSAQRRRPTRGRSSRSRSSPARTGRTASTTRTR